MKNHRNHRLLVAVLPRLLRNGVLLPLLPTKKKRPNSLLRAALPLSLAVPQVDALPNLWMKRKLYQRKPPMPRHRQMPPMKKMRPLSRHVVRLRPSPQRVRLVLPRQAHG